MEDHYSSLKRPALPIPSAGHEKKRKAQGELQAQSQEVEDLLAKHRTSAKPSLKQELESIKHRLYCTHKKLGATNEENAKLSLLRRDQLISLGELQRDNKRLQDRLRRELEDHEQTKEALQEAEESQEAEEELRQELEDNISELADELETKNDLNRSYEREVFELRESIDDLNFELSGKDDDVMNARYSLRCEKRRRRLWVQRCQALHEMLKGEVQDRHKDSPDALKEILDGLHRTFGVHLEEEKTTSDYESDCE